MEDFEQRVERFFKQLRSCLGIEPDLRASFVSKEQYPIYGDEELFSEIIESPRLPFDYNNVPANYMGSDGVVRDYPVREITTDSKYSWQTLIKKWGVDPKYKVNTEIIGIKKAMVSDNLEVSEALLIIDDYELEYWGKKITDRNDILVTSKIIFTCIEDWIKKREADEKETVDFDMLSYMFIDELHDKRKEFYNRLISSIKNEITIEKKNFIIEEMGGAKFCVPLDKPSVPVKNKKSLTEEEKAQALKKFNDAIQNQKNTLKKLADEAKEASDRSSKMLLGISNNKPNTLHKMLLALHEAGRMCIKEWKNNVDTDTETERHLRKQVLITKLNEIEKYKKLCIEGKQNQDSLGYRYRELIGIEDELKQIKKDFLNSSKTGGITISGSVPNPYIPNTISTSKLPEKKPTPTEKESAKNFAFKNKFNNKSYEFIYDHFKKGLVDGEDEYLSEDKLKEWIEEAFGQYPNPPKERYLLKNTKGNTLFIKDVFFRFYDTCGAWGDSEKYASLCGNYFQGHTTKQVEATWHKYKNTRKRN